MNAMRIETLTIGTDIILEKGERLFTFKIKRTGGFCYSTSKYPSKFIDGVEFLTVFPKPRNKTDRTPMLMRAEALEKVIV